MTDIPATLPVGEIVRRLNQAPPAVLLAHTSTLVLLAGEQHAGRLRIVPRMITAISELLTEEDRAAIGGAFGVPPVSQFVSTEGLAGCTRPGDAVLRFATDMCIVELTDRFLRHPADGDPYLHATVEGRADEIFRYGTVTIDAAIVADGALDHPALASSLRHSLHAAGLAEPHVDVHEVAGIARHAQTGKTRRFIAL